MYSVYFSCLIVMTVITIVFEEKILKSACARRFFLECFKTWKIIIKLNPVWEFIANFLSQFRNFHWKMIPWKIAHPLQPNMEVPSPPGGEGNTFYEDFMVKLVWRLSWGIMETAIFYGDFMLKVMLHQGLKVKKLSNFSSFMSVARELCRISL